MRYDKIVIVVLAFLVVTGFLALVFGNIFDVERVRPDGEEPVRGGGPSAAAGPSTAPPAAPEKKKAEGLDPALLERINRLDDAEIRVLSNVSEAEKKLKLSPDQREVVVSLFVESLAEMNAAADEAAKSNDPALFDKALEKVETETKASLKKVLNPAQLEILKRMEKKVRGN